MDLTMYDKETIERARHRGRAYLCLACFHLKKQRPIVVCVVYIMVLMHSSIVGHKREFTVSISCIYCEI